MFSQVEKFRHDLEEIGYSPQMKDLGSNQFFFIIPDYVINEGKFKGQMINLGIPATLDYPRSVAPSIHVNAEPQLLHEGRTNAVNVIASVLGVEWRYWSFRFKAYPEQTALQLMNQINTIFRNVQ